MILFCFQHFYYIIKIKMEIRIDFKEITNRPNDLELGKFVREMYWKQKEQYLSNIDEHVRLDINEDGLVVGIQNTDDEYESCIVCGRKTKYKKSTHVDLRRGYIDGAGQACDGSCRE